MEYKETNAGATADEKWQVVERIFKLPGLNPNPCTSPPGNLYQTTSVLPGSRMCPVGTI